MASKNGIFLEEDARKRLIRSLEVAGDLKRSETGDLEKHSNAEGCRICGKDNDHACLMLCEGCDAEFHYYCIDPPLHAVPHDDWYCDKCRKGYERFDKDDGLSSLVIALPKKFTSRYGEVCWAYGGVGFGWWPSCIFDPRLTEGSARQTARKNLGKKHLVYFFECQEAPFAVLSDNKIMPWHEGLADNYHLGKTARSSGRHRTLQFQQALQAAIIEEDKPLELRLDWNRPEEQPQLLPLPKKKKKKRKQTSTSEDVHKSPQGAVRSGGESDLEDSTMKRASKRPKKEKKPLFCKILKSNPQSASDEGKPSKPDGHIGFVKVSSTKKSTFRDIRKAVMKDLVPEVLSADTKWKFHISTLGNVTSKQEKSLGPVIPFLRSGIGGNQKNAGTIGDPITVLIVEEE